MMEKKKVIITLCKVFPVTHSRNGELTGFEDSINAGTKIHTIRYNAKGVWGKRYEDICSGKKYLSVREWTGRPYNSEQREYARYDKIGLQRIVIIADSERVSFQCIIDGKNIPVEDVAKNDALSVDDFKEWFFKDQKQNIFEGVVIQLTDFRY